MKTDLQDADVLCIYGYGKGELEATYHAWLKENPQKYLVFIEDEAEVMAHLLPRLSGTSLDEHPQKRIYFLAQANPEEILKWISWEFVFLKLAYEIHPHYLESKKEKAQETLAAMKHFQEGVHLLASDYSDLGKGIFQNVISNLPRLTEAKLGKTLWGRFKEMPAIICGAGPSLVKNIANLKNASSSALIFAGGSALNVLCNEGILPHFSASIDPSPPLKRFLHQTAFEVPFFYQNRLAKQILQWVHAPLLWMPDSGGYPIEAHLSQQLGIEAVAWDGGWNVATFCCAVAQAMGCHPILFVGMDLSCSQNRYAPGVENSGNEGLVEVISESGERLYSQRDWLIAKQWIEEFIQAHAETTFINATEGGLSLKGTLEMSLKEALKRYGVFADLSGRTHALVMQAPLMGVDFEQIEGAVDGILGSLRRCEQLCKEMLQFMEEIYPESPLEKGKFALLEVDLAEEVAYQTILLPLWNIWKFAIERNSLYRNHMKSREFDKEGSTLSKTDSSCGFGISHATLNQLLFFRRIICEYVEEGTV